MTLLRRLVPSLGRNLLLVATCALQTAFGAVAAQGAALPAPARGPGEYAQVLVLTGSDPYLPAFVAIDGAMRNAVAQRHQRSVVWLHESIDTLRLGGVPGPMLAELLASKYANVRIDAVVLVTELAVEFFVPYRERLWPNAAVIFHSVAPRFVGRLPPGAAISGIPAEVDYAGAVRIALELQPGASRLLVIGGVSPFDELQLASAREALAPFAGRLNIEYLIGLSPQKMAERLSRATLDTIVLYTSLFRDSEGHVYLPRAVLETLSAASGTPIYGSFDSYVGHGLAAGAVESFRERGERVAELLVRALDGELAGGAVIEPTPPSNCVVDGRQLQRYGLPTKAVPAGCDVRYVEASFLERHWWQSLLVALALLAQSALIVALLLQSRRRRAAELSLQSQRSQLLHASRLAVAGELTASIAHEINQPLGAILSNADAAELLLESGQMQRDELLQILADIKRDDLRASEVIKRLRVLLARHEVERRRFGLNDAVARTAAILSAEARRRAVKVEYALQAQRADVLGDSVQIQQVIINLMLNAFDACAELPEDARRVRVETSDTPNGVRVSVRDFGIGIAAADLPHVFESFFSTKRSGMGLGLAIARSIVEAHGGTISASRCEVGAEFRIILPTAPMTDHSGQLVTNAS